MADDTKNTSRKINSWRFLDTGRGNAVFNMAADLALAESVDKGESPPVVRVYGWKPPAVSVGYSRNPGDVLDIKACKEDGVMVVRRPTGGRALYHDDELSWSLCARIDDPYFGGGLGESLDKCSVLIQRVLAALGAPVSTGSGCDGISGGGERRTLCFAGYFGHEHMWEGRKITGTAQRRFKRVFLQHGSIMLGPGREKIAKYLRNCSDNSTLKYILLNRGVSLAEIDIPDVLHDYDACAAAMYNALSELVDVPPVRGALTDNEILRAREKSGMYSMEKGW
jgi:lipoate-protein ligase A